jgi:SGNH hydrolase-like domain, acetyltransferase AlgX
VAAETGESRVFKKVVKVLAQAIAIAAITAVLCEIGFRIYHAINPAFIFPTASYNRFRGKPFAPDYDFHLNSRGFKDVEWAKHKAPGTCRILAIGDSFAFAGVPYRYAFLTRLEEMINPSGHRYEVLNMGIPGLGPPEYLELLATEGMPLGPNAVICFFFIGNDFIDELRPSEGFNSYLAAFLRYLFKIVPEAKGRVIHGAAHYVDDKPTMERSVYLAIEKSRALIFRKDNPEFPGLLEHAFTPLLRMRDICARAHVAFRVVLMPDEAQVSLHLQSELLRAFAPLRAGDFDITLPDRLLGERLRQAGIPYLDLLDDFVREGAKRPLYIPSNSHWNIAGNELAAEKIAAWLERDGLDTLCGGSAER